MVKCFCLTSKVFLYLNGSMRELYLKTSNENSGETEIESLAKWLWLFEPQAFERQVNTLFGAPEQLAAIVASYESIAASLEPPIFFKRAFVLGGYTGQSLAKHPRDTLFLQHLYIQRHCLQTADLYRQQRPVLQALAPSCPDLAAQPSFEQKVESLKTPPDLSPPPWIEQEIRIDRTGDSINLKNRLQDLNAAIKNYEKLSQNTEGQDLLARWQIIACGLEIQAGLLENLLESQKIQERRRPVGRTKRGPFLNRQIAPD